MLATRISEKKLRHNSNGRLPLAGLSTRAPSEVRDGKEFVYGKIFKIQTTKNQLTVETHQSDRASFFTLLWLRSLLEYMECVVDGLESLGSDVWDLPFI